MGKIIIKDNIKRFVNINANLMDSALGRMAKDIATITKIKIPFKTGDLQKEVVTRRISILKHQVRIDKEYASYQEKGERMDGSHKVRNYTTPSTGPHFLENAGVKVSNDALNYLKQAAQLARL